MGRPTTNTITVSFVAGRPQPWRAQWRFTDARGDRRKTARHFTTQAEALAFKAEVETIAASLPAAPAVVVALPAAPKPRRGGVLTFQEFAEGWLEDVAARKAPATQKSYAGMLRTHAFPHLGATLVTDDHLDAQAIISTITSRAKAGVSWGTQRLVIRIIFNCLEWARINGRLRSNPATRLTKVLNDQNYEEPEPNPLTAQQAADYLHWLQTGIARTAPAQRPVDGPKRAFGREGVRSAGYPHWFPYFATLLGTGVRRGEAAAARWTNAFLDAAPGRLRINRSQSPASAALARKEGRPADGDKALKGRTLKHYRDVELHPVLAEILREHARTRREDALQQRRPVSPYLFLTERGTRVLADNETAERIFALGMAALGLTAAEHTIHDLRDTFATVHLETSGGRKLAWVSAQLGHKNISTTTNRYVKWIPSATSAGYADELPYLTPQRAAKVDARGDGS